MDTSWCLACSRHLEGDQDVVYCSDACFNADNACPSSSSFSSPLPPSSPSTHVSQWHGSGHAGIRAWANAVHPGPPPSHRSRSSSPDCDRTPSPSRRSRFSSSSSLRPKLLDLPHRPLPPSLSISLSSTEMLPSTSVPPSPLPSPPQPINSTPTQRARALASQRFSLSCTTGPTATTTESQSLATPVTPAMPIPYSNHIKTRQPHKALWRQVRDWVGPTSPTPTALAPPLLVQGVDSKFAVLARAHKHPLVLLDEDLLATAGFAKGRDELDDEEEESRGDGLAGWFVAKAQEQQASREKEKTRTKSRAKDAGGVKKSAHTSQQQQKPSRADQTAFLKRGRTLERSSAMAVYQSMR